jgi:hypothetical protein
MNDKNRNAGISLPPSAIERLQVWANLRECSRSHLVLQMFQLWEAEQPEDDQQLVKLQTEALAMEQAVHE